MEFGEKYQVKVSKRFAAWENLDEIEDINRPWDSTTNSIKSQLKKV
jgi:hypothetical protein